ncbi:MAG: Stp1/IreP family PP2C-type Ser/Thr phosphatase [Actinomycetota bacterium]
MRLASKSDIGKLRDINEDAYLVDGSLFAVADGMGGHRAGEIASELGLRTFREAFGPPEPDASEDAILMAIKKAVDQANTVIHARAAENKEYKGMGTTLTAAFFARGRLYVAQVGDSRAYLLRAGVIRQLTTDHTLVGEMIAKGEIDEEIARIHPLRHVITRALGTYAAIESEVYVEELAPGDKILLCSDGLSSKVDNDAIGRIVNDYKSLIGAINGLVKAALNAGGEDNITAVLAEFTEADFV